MKRIESNQPAKGLNNALITKYVEYFNKRDFNGISGLLAFDAVYSFVTQNSKEYGKDTIMNASHHPSHYERTDLVPYTH
jgi:hypothetical protein